MKKEIYYCDICGKEMKKQDYVTISIDIRFKEQSWSNYHINKSTCKITDICPACTQKLHTEFEKMGLPFEYVVE